MLNVLFQFRKRKKPVLWFIFFFKVYKKESSAAYMYMLDDMIYLNNGVYSLIRRINREFQILLNDGDYFSLFHVYFVYIFKGKCCHSPFLFLV